MERQGQMRWYNPSLGDFEWRDVPASDEEALALLGDSPICLKVYREWRDLGANIVAALIRAGDAVREEGER